MSPFAGFSRAFYGHPGRWAVGTAKTLACCHLIWTYGYSVGPASGPSMLPTFSVAGDWLLVAKRFRGGRDVRVGDLVVYRIPVEPADEAVKRVMGMPGDYVLVNSPEGQSDLMIQVPQGHCFLVGDNLPASRDSRTFGPVPLALVRGKVIAKTWEWIVNPMDAEDAEAPV
ncbi:mitochondrial inner membrane protease subunit 1 [Sporothrix schenckii 1099-18]|uniref:Mitochondrial inner membrane protease subunit 1 n=2 Tax=Sporothrix TaxID=29907 RepID=A0A0C2J4Z9_9PEZI|nr:mitochondrial inner membrane protease subunit 1 [Sporothrix schenckii 1099-18]XP_040622105.1 mitochondrial inner membrane protease subunit 1 [Sporothrix brasiliensis 5110]KIH94095.1 mitochondrial inner membrane protease subunit 1 [Sporothrix brasiliensis 5110]KJR83294.1 mitochondrial inner membrane protease subunit 1 [Sporothrix schenckii 1099-18]